MARQTVHIGSDTIDRNVTQFDTHMMDIALRLAMRGLGQTSPNPSVGAVIADEAASEVIARGWTQPGGRPHAETEALQRAGEKARGRTLYVTLEPCAHHGKTPPCVDAILAAGLKRVVVGLRDPDPRTAGEGLERLRSAGVDVTEGVCEAEACRVTLGHSLRVTEKRPFVQLKLALDDKGRVPRGSGGRPTFVTGAEARAAGQMLRARADAILVGTGTVRDDDPDLTCRLPGLAHRSPIRVVLSGRGGLSPQSRLVNGAARVPVWLFASDDGAVTEMERLAAAGVRAFTKTGPGECYAAREILGMLADQGITRLLVEGGPGMWQLFAPVADEVVVIKAGLAALPILPLSVLGPGGTDSGLALASVRRIGDDRMFVYRRS